MPKRITRKDKEAEARLIEKTVEKVMERVLPVLEQTFTEQNNVMMQIMNRTITDGYKMILEHSVDERKEALASLEDDAGEYIKIMEEKEDDDEDEQRAD